MANSITPLPFYPSTQAAEEQSAGIRDPIVDPDDTVDETQELTFADVLDILNPLQHIPGISSVYRALTGDEIAPGPQLAGDLLYGGPAALLSAGARALFEEASGVKADSLVASALGVDEAAGPPETKVADVKTATVSAEPAEPPKALESPAVGNAAAMAALARDLRGLTQGLRNEQQPQPNAPATHRAERTEPEPPNDRPWASAPDPKNTNAAASRHANLPPSGASPEWIAQAMQRALAKYHNAARAAGPAPPPPLVR